MAGLNHTSATFFITAVQHQHSDRRQAVHRLLVDLVPLPHQLLRHLEQPQLLEPPQRLQLLEPLQRLQLLDLVVRILLLLLRHLEQLHLLLLQHLAQHLERHLQRLQPLEVHLELQLLLQHRLLVEELLEVLLEGVQILLEQVCFKFRVWIAILY